MRQLAALTLTFLRIFSRDRQAIFFSLFFPVIFISVFGLVGSAGEDPIAIGVVDQADTVLSRQFTAALTAQPRFALTQGSEDTLRPQVIEGSLTLLLVIPAGFDDKLAQSTLRVVADTSQVRQLDLVLPVLNQALVDIERQLRNTPPLFSLQLEDVEARPQNYLAFLVPGMLAFVVMQISIAGSGYNIVEYRRKGILKRLFVTPLAPRSFIGALVVARSLLCLLQLSLLLGYALWVLQVPLAGSLLLLYGVILLGTATFLSLGFCLGSLAKTQQTIMALGNIATFPQLLLSGVFYPIDILPDFIQPLARVLPLSFLADALRGIAVDAATLATLWPQLLGLAFWCALFLLLATRLFVWKDVAA